MISEAIRPERGVGFVFRKRRDGLWICTISRRVIKPVFGSHGLEWEGWQGFAGVQPPT